MVFEKYTPERCYNHKDRIAVYYETASGLYFCADCQNGLSKATSNDLRKMAGLKPLDYKSTESSSKQFEEDKVKDRENKERERERDKRLKEEADRDNKAKVAEAEAEEKRLAALDKAEKERIKETPKVPESVNPSLNLGKK